MIVVQKWVTSRDGTKVPYFLIGKESVINKGKAPLLLYGYGGFQLSRTPYYLGIEGQTLLEKGAVFALANIRGGGEFGPQWHKICLKEKSSQSL